jgi:hypothetical protein
MQWPYVEKDQQHLLSKESYESSHNSSLLPNQTKKHSVRCSHSSGVTTGQRGDAGAWPLKNKMPDAAELGAVGTQ